MATAAPRPTHSPDELSTSAAVLFWLVFVGIVVSISVMAISNNFGG